MDGTTRSIEETKADMDEKIEAAEAHFKRRVQDLLDYVENASKILDLYKKLLRETTLPDLSQKVETPE